MELSRRNQTVLVVENNSAVRETITAILELEGYAVITATDGVEALSAFEQRQSSISLLLTDLIIPDMKADELADRVLELDPQIPLLFIMGALYGKAGNPGAEPEYGAKFFACSELINSVNKLLDPQRRAKKISARA